MNPKRANPSMLQKHLIKKRNNSKAFSVMQTLLLCEKAHIGRDGKTFLPPEIMLAVGNYKSRMDAGTDILVFNGDSTLYTTSLWVAWIDTVTMKCRKVAEKGFPYFGSGAASTKLLDGTVLISGGDSKLAMSDKYNSFIYNPLNITKSTSKKCKMNCTRIGHAMVTLPVDGRAMAIGGRKYWGISEARQKSVEFYSPVSRKWTLGTAEMKTGLSGVAAVVLSDGKRVLIIGGLAAIHQDETTAGCQIYDTETNIFADAADMNTARGQHRACLLPNGNVFVTGGLSDGKVLQLCEEYHPSTNTWTAAPSMTYCRMSHACVFVGHNNTVLVFGGCISNCDATAHESFSLSTRQWTCFESDPLGRCNFAYAVL